MRCKICALVVVRTATRDQISGSMSPDLTCRMAISSALLTQPTCGVAGPRVRTHERRGGSAGLAELIPWWWRCHHGSSVLADPAQLRRIAPFFPLSHGVPRVDDRRVVSGILHLIRNGLRWRDAAEAYRPHKTLYNRFVRWSRLGIFNRIFSGLAGQAGEPDRLMIDATHLKAHRTAASLLQRGRSGPGATACAAGWGGTRRVLPDILVVRRAA